MPERDPIELPRRSRERPGIVPMKPYVETPEIKKPRSAVIKQELHLAVNSLKRIWHDIIDPHRH